MAIIKKVRKNKPFKGARGQYNFEGNINSGLYPHIDDKFLDKDLYSINEGNDVNEIILGESYSIQIENDSHFTIKELRVDHSGAAGDPKNVSFRVWIVDDIAFNNTATGLGIDKSIADLSNNDISAITNQLTTGGARIYLVSGGGAGIKIDDSNGAIFYHIFDNTSEDFYNSTFSTDANPDYEYELNLGSTLYNPDLATYTNKQIYIIVRMDGDVHHWLSGTMERDHRLQLFSVPVNEIETAETSMEFNFEYGDSIKVWTYGGGGNIPLWLCGKLHIEASKGFLVDTSVPQNIIDAGYGDLIDFPLFISNDNYDGIVGANPRRVINWPDDANMDFNFYPGTIITATSDTDIQSYYSDNIYRFKASSPTTIDLDFKIYQDTFAGILKEYEYGVFNPDNCTSICDCSCHTGFIVPRWKDEECVCTIGGGTGGPPCCNNPDSIKFKFFVMDWNDKENKIHNWSSIMDQWVENMDDFINRQQDDLFKFGEIYHDGTEYVTDDTKRLKHTYISPGLKSIKAVIFSYLEDTDGIQFQILRWKFVTIGIYLDNAKSLLEDFSDIGGADFVTLPWPTQTPIISGISQDSQYIISIENVLASGKLSEVDVIDSSLLFNAKNNDELGDYLGYTDFEQTRVFKGSYSMAELLKIDDQMVINGNFNPHTDTGDTGYWDGETNTFPTESCVGTIFINDNMDQNLRESCIIELNSQELEGDIIRDSSGNGNKGILIGDYRIDKPSKDVPIRRKTEPKISEPDSEDGAI